MPFLCPSNLLDRTQIPHWPRTAGCEGRGLGSGPVQRYTKETKGQVIVEHLPAYSPDLNPDEQVWNHAKARLSKLFVATKEEFKAALFSIMFSIQRTRELVRSFFQLPSTKYAQAA